VPTDGSLAGASGCRSSITRYAPDREGSTTVPTPCHGSRLWRRIGPSSRKRFPVPDASFISIWLVVSLLVTCFIFLEIARLGFVDPWGTISEGRQLFGALALIWHTPGRALRITYGLQTWICNLQKAEWPTGHCVATQFSSYLNRVMQRAGAVRPRIDQDRRVAVGGQIN